MKPAHKKGAPDERSPWVLTTSRGHGMLGLRRPAGVSLTTPLKEYNGTISGPFTSRQRLLSRSDNDGSSAVSAYRGIGSETVRCPVVVTGHDPNIGDYRLVGSAQEVPAEGSISSGLWMLSAISPPGNPLEGLYKP